LLARSLLRLEKRRQSHIRIASAANKETKIASEKMYHPISRRLLSTSFLCLALSTHAGAKTIGNVLVSDETTNIAVVDPIQVRPIATGEPVALYITLCLWSALHPAATCREVPLTPGAAGPTFVSMQACQEGQEEAMVRWRVQAGSVFGFTGMAGDGYRIEGKRCGLAMGNPRDE
jgi:hypothetical protein